MNFGRESRMPGLREQVVEIKQEVDEDLEDVDSEEQNWREQMDQDWQAEGQEFSGLSTEEKSLLHREQARQRRKEKRASLTEKEMALRRQKDAERKRELRAKLAQTKCATPDNIPVRPKKEPRSPLPEEEIALRRKREADRKRERRAKLAAQKRDVHSETQKPKRKKSRLPLTEDKIALHRKREAARQRERRAKLAAQKRDDHSEIQEPTRKKSRLPLTEDKIALYRKREAERQRERRAKLAAQKRDDHSEIQEPKRKKSRLPLTEDKIALRRQKEAERKRKIRSQFSEEEKALLRQKAAERKRELRRARSSGTLPPPVYPRRTRQENYMDIANFLRRAEDKIRDQQKSAIEKWTFSINEDETTKENLLEIRALKMSVEAMKMAGLEIIRASVKSAVEFVKRRPDKQQKAEISNAKIRMNKQPVNQSGTNAYKRRAPDPNSHQEMLPIPFNSRNKSFDCFVCNCEFKALKGIKEHLPSHTASELSEAKEKYSNSVDPSDKKTQEIVFTVYTCEICSDKSYSIFYYRKHIIEKHKDNKEILSKVCFPCSFCPEVTTARHLLKMHLEKFHEMFTQCPICSENIKTQASFTNHLEIHSDADLKNENEGVFEFEDGYFCKTCGYCSRSYNTVATHIKEDHSEEGVCLESSRTGYKRRAPVPHSYKETFPVPFNKETSSYICFVCNCKFEVLSGVKLHLPSHSAAELSEAQEKYKNAANPPNSETQNIIFNVFTCEICSDKTYSVDYYRKHIIGKHNDNKEILSKFRFPCPFCPEVSVARYVLMLHLTKFHDIFTQCPICDENFKTQASFVNHIEMHSDADLKNKNKSVFEYKEGFFCKTCGLCSRSYKMVATHIKEDHSEKPLFFDCTNCNFKYETKKALRRHQNDAHGNEIFFCEVCGKELKSALSLKHHIKSHTRNSNKKEVKRRITCHSCEKTFASKSSFQVHYLAAHQSGKVFQCNICGEAFSYYTALNQHKVTVCEKEKAKQRSCPVCGKVLANYLLLSHHKMNFHKYGNTQENVCHVCDKTFKDSFNLYIHNNAKHAQREPLTCAYCKERSFSNKLHLLEHWRLHKNDRPYKCSACEMEFKFKKTFYKHRTDKHSHEMGNVKFIVDHDIDKKLKAEFHAAHESQLLKKVNQDKDSTSEITPAHQNNVNTITQNVPLDAEMTDLTNNIDDYPETNIIKDCSIVQKKANNTNKNYIDFSRANIPEMRLLMLQKSVGSGDPTEPEIIQGVVQENIPKGTAPFEEDENGFSTVESPFPINEYYTSDLPSPMEPPSPMEQSENDEDVKENKPFVCAGDVIPADPFPRRLMVVIERLRACVLCNDVFPSMAVYREHMKSKSHRVAQRAKKREEIVDRDWEESEEEEELRRRKKLKRSHGKEKSQGTRNISFEEIYKCAFCPETFSNIGDHIKHRLEHLKRATCLICPEKFVSDRKLVLHYISEHNGEHIIKCEQCGMGFLDYKSEQLRVHVRNQHLRIKKTKRVHEKKAYGCDICGARIVGMPTLRTHLLSHENDKHKCVHCSKEFRFITDLENHYNEVHDGDMPNSCEKCPQKFPTPYRLQLHEQLEHGQKKKVKKISDGLFPCPFCDEKYTNLVEYTKHTKTHKGKADCIICPERFSTVRKLVEHYISKHEEQKIVRCRICNQGFLDYKERHLKEHLRDVHGVNRRNQQPRKRKAVKRIGHTSFSCDFCGERFTGVTLLKSHLESQHAEKQKCVHCQMEFDNITEVESHYNQVHDGDMPFQCTECPMKFSIECRLQLHMKKEHCENMFSPAMCDICGVVISTEYSMKRHKEKHADKEARQKFYCEYCGKSYLHEYSLIVHRRKHTGENPYPCTICEGAVAFYTLDLLNCHMRRVHKSFTCDICGESFRRETKLLQHRETHKSGPN